MNSRPDRSLLKQCIVSLAAHMKLEPLPEKLSDELIDHVLLSGGDGEFDRRQAHASFEAGLITSDEYVDQMMAHAFARIERYNQTTSTWHHSPLRSAFCAALLGKSN